ncbi:MAG: hypothetical protein CMJ98_03345 [Planctomycetes bacterium]|jgi:predicted deacylase/glutamine amidotransferase-like uncharacterized protein|nr:hypothetical protein [Planctomycetota bacterium]MBV20902.1 hypothetical protein [Planctomycetaceae bacterium]HJM56598.1 BPL-N domain-containing protein [Planctomycetota bacterium]
MLCVARIFGLWPLISACLPVLAAQDLAQDSPWKVPQVTLIAKGTEAETPCWILTAEETGPTVLIVGGMHGNEPSGAAVAEQITSWSIGRGQLIVVPRANVLALEAEQRRTPGKLGDVGDLNRQFPRDGEPSAGIATALWGLLEIHDPDWVIDLHEGFDFHRTNPKSVGSSIIHCADARAEALALKLIAAVDATIEEPGQRFDRLRTPVAGSLARAAWEKEGVRSMIFETTTKSHVLSHRVRQHRLLMHTFLSELGMQPSPAATVIGPGIAPNQIRVAVFDGSGTGKGAASTMRSVLEGQTGCIVRLIGSPDVRAGVLSQFDIVVHPGGSGSAQAKALGVEGRAQEVAFVRAGGGYLGVCAGAYLASCNYDWSLGVLDAQVIDRKHWRRGVGGVDVEWTPLGKRTLAGGSSAQEVQLFEIQYANGPIFLPGEVEGIPDFQALLVYRGEIAKNGAPKGVMPSTAAVIRSSFGQGRAMAFSPHPEKTDGLHALLHNSLLWLAGDGQ